MQTRSYSANIIMIIIIYVLIYIVSVTSPVFAGGNLKKLQTLGDNMALQQQVFNQEDKNYDKAQEFINSPDIKKGVSSDSVLKRCGEPVAIVNDGKEWVYKPSSSTFFKGDKIYFTYDNDSNLIDWKSVHLE